LLNATKTPNHSTLECKILFFIYPDNSKSYDSIGWFRSEYDCHNSTLQISWKCKWNHSINKLVSGAILSYFDLEVKGRVHCFSMQVANEHVFCIFSKILKKKWHRSVLSFSRKTQKTHL